MTVDKAIVLNFPQKPGVYLMKNSQGRVLYVGKAKNLRKRVLQYFSSKSERVQVPFLIAQVTTIDTIVVHTEKEALLLENTLIKKYKPKYNVLLKDDKTYIALKINHQNKWPKVSLIRYRGKPKDSDLYFGPYASAYAARETLDLIHKIFPLRQCSDQELKRRRRPCILYQMGRCIAPCVGLCTPEEYRFLVRKTIEFLKGKDKQVLKELYQKMEAYSDKLEFEKANQVLKTIRQIEKTIEKQRVDIPSFNHIDVWGIFRESTNVVINRLIFRYGKLIGSLNFSFSKVYQPLEEVLESFLVQFYDGEVDLPKQILLPIKLIKASALSEILSHKTSHKISIQTPLRGDKKQIVEMANENAKAFFLKEKDKQTLNEKVLLQLKECLRLKNYPSKIECFDNSNIGSTEPVSVMVVFKDGEKDKRSYRKYKLHLKDKPNDYQALEEVLKRRYSKVKEEKNTPNLLIVDGGKGHLNVALKVLKELDIINLDVIAIAKEKGLHTKGVTQETIFLPNTKDPVYLSKHSSVLLFLQKVRDEAHRFAIGFHRNRRDKKSLSSVLDAIPGIGPIKKKNLLKTFGSVEGIRKASKEALLKVEGITCKDVENLKKELLKQV